MKKINWKLVILCVVTIGAGMFMFGGVEGNMDMESEWIKLKYDFKQIAPALGTSAIC